jgi:N-acetyl-anhydromuramyl-L-alanine amidase AmpD
VIHHTATSRGSVESIHEAHLQRKDKVGNAWLGIGYHFVIGNGNGMVDGAIESTFRWREQLHGAHAGGSEHNQHGIGIALVGNFEEEPPSPAQLAATKRLVAALKSEYRIKSDQVVAHTCDAHRRR